MIPILFKFITFEICINESIQQTNRCSNQSDTLQYTYNELQELDITHQNKKTGRPFRSTTKEIHQYQIFVKQSIDKSTARFVHEDSVLPKGSYTKILKNMSMRNKITISRIVLQIRSDKLKGDGKKSPFKSIKEKLLIFIKCMNNTL